MRILQVFYKLVSTNKRRIKAATYLALSVEYSLERQILDANLSLLEVLLCGPLDCWCPISLLCLTFNEVNDCAWDLSNITSLKVMSVVGPSGRVLRIVTFPSLREMVIWA